MAVEPSESPAGCRLPHNHNAKRLCVVYEKGCNSALSCGSYCEDIHAVGRTSNCAEKGNSCLYIYHNKHEIKNKRSAAHVSLQSQKNEDRDRGEP